MRGYVSLHQKEDTSGCTGAVFHLDEFTTPDGNEFTYVQTDPNVVASGVATRGTDQMSLLSIHLREKDSFLRLPVKYMPQNGHIILHRIVFSVGAR